MVVGCQKYCVDRVNIVSISVSTSGGGDDFNMSLPHWKAHRCWWDKGMRKEEASVKGKRSVCLVRY